MQTEYKGRLIQADQVDVALPSSWGGRDDGPQGWIKVDGVDVTDQVAVEGGDLETHVQRAKALIDSGEI
ncbi:hypothetical protein EHF33_03025 [Deinococcus psychrotolerans]|uniref:Uncharacterized protein n=2 Tax=Deinococcus TaxID=1298 RepID=A0A553UZS8_9DEIO|nr:MULTISPECIES: hypothetical protein [Deinococcus]AZI41848.1 hypothetical protein EHF33_03025 [Deinococcus psychrotolerans]TSA85698.1 hypothetical protein FNU79_09620 [Deinococcus detaillensis]